jgi:endonuclease/exonuclease/phosphatase (EEP) superfamily protein YafD
MKLCLLFSTAFSIDYLDSVVAKLKEYGFDLAQSWEYPGLSVPLDHIFLRGGLKLMDFKSFANKSDHKGAVFTISMSGL